MASQAHKASKILTLSKSTPLKTGLEILAKALSLSIVFKYGFQTPSTSTGVNLVSGSLQDLTGPEIVREVAGPDLAFDIANVLPTVAKLASNANSFTSGSEGVWLELFELCGALGTAYELISSQEKVKPSGCAITEQIFLPPLQVSAHIDSVPNLRKDLTAASNAVWKFYYSEADEEDFRHSIEKINASIQESVTTYHQISDLEVDTSLYGQVRSEHFQQVQAALSSVTRQLKGLIKSDINSVANKKIIKVCSAELERIQSSCQQIGHQSGSISDLVFATPIYLARRFEKETALIILNHIGLFFPDRPEPIAKFLAELRVNFRDQWEDIEAEVCKSEEETNMSATSSKKPRKSEAERLIDGFTTTTQSNPESPRMTRSQVQSTRPTTKLPQPKSRIPATKTVAFQEANTKNHETTQLPQTNSFINQIFSNVKGKAKTVQVPQEEVLSQQTEGGGQTEGGEQTEAEQTEAEQTEAEQTEAEQTEAEQTEAEQTEAEQTEAEQTEAEQTEAEQTEAEQIKEEEEEQEDMYGPDPEQNNNNDDNDDDDPDTAIPGGFPVDDGGDDVSSSENDIIVESGAEDRAPMRPFKNRGQGRRMGKAHVRAWNFHGGNGRKVAVEYVLGQARTGRVESGRCHPNEQFLHATNIAAQNPIVKKRSTTTSRPLYTVPKVLYTGTVYWDATGARDDEPTDVLRPSSHAYTVYATTYLEVYVAKLGRRIVSRPDLSKLLCMTEIEVARFLYKQAVRQEAEMARARGELRYEPERTPEAKENTWSGRRRRLAIRKRQAAADTDYSDFSSGDSDSPRPTHRTKSIKRSSPVASRESTRRAVTSDRRDDSAYSVASGALRGTDEPYIDRGRIGETPVSKVPHVKRLSSKSRTALDEKLKIKDTEARARSLKAKSTSKANMKTEKLTEKSIEQSIERAIREEIEGRIRAEIERRTREEMAHLEESRNEKKVAEAGKKMKVNKVKK